MPYYLYCYCLKRKSLYFFIFLYSYKVLLLTISLKARSIAQITKVFPKNWAFRPWESKHFSKKIVSKELCQLDNWGLSMLNDLHIWRDLYPYRLLLHHILCYLILYLVSLIYTAILPYFLKNYSKVSSLNFVILSCFS